MSPPDLGGRHIVFGYVVACVACVIFLVNALTFECF